MVTATGPAQSTQFVYDTPGYAEVTRMTTAAGGELRWTYGTLTYAGGVTQREVTKRSLVMAAGGTVVDAKD